RLIRRHDRLLQALTRHALGNDRLNLPELLAAHSGVSFLTARHPSHCHLWPPLTQKIEHPRRASSLRRSTPLARPASCPGSRSPAISASIIARPDWHSSVLATESILIPASSSVLASRCPSAVRASISRLRYRVR